MKDTIKIMLSFSLFLILVIGVSGYYYKVHSAKTNLISVSNFSDNNEEDPFNEEDPLKEDFIKRIVIYENKTCFFALSHRIVNLFSSPDCILEGYTGLVTPPPWS